MRLRTREINVFSISALDLFASAMGGFMLLTIIFMPFFPNTGDSAIRVAEVQAELAGVESKAEVTREELAEVEEELAEAEEELAAAAEEAEELQRRIAELEDILAHPDLKFPPLDIVIALDTTGSMSELIDGLKAETTQVLEIFDVLSPSVAMGIIDFKDRCMGADQIRTYPLEVVSASTVSAIRRFTSAMTTDNPCNPDSEEAIGAAIDAAVAMNWRDSAELHLIVIITDNPAYPFEQARVLDVASRFRDRGEGYQVSTAFVPTGGSGRDYLRDLAARGGGSFADAGASMAATLLRAMVGT